MNELVRPASVILTHVERGGDRRRQAAARFAHRGAHQAAQGAAPHLAISGRTMEFDGKGKCVAGC